MNKLLCETTQFLGKNKSSKYVRFQLRPEVFSEALHIKLKSMK